MMSGRFISIVSSVALMALSACGGAQQQTVFPGGGGSVSPGPIVTSTFDAQSTYFSLSIVSEVNVSYFSSGSQIGGQTLKERNNDSMLCQFSYAPQVGSNSNFRCYKRVTSANGQSQYASLSSAESLLSFSRDGYQLNTPATYEKRSSDQGTLCRKFTDPSASGGLAFSCYTLL